MLDLSNDTTIQCSVTLKTFVVKGVDDLIKAEHLLQPEIKHKINRSSVISILVAEALEARKNAE